MLRILQWNARSLIANGQEFKRYICELKQKPEVICVQETWLKPTLDFRIPGYECIRCDRADVINDEGEFCERTGGGCATFIRNGVQFQKVYLNAKNECVTVELWKKQGGLLRDSRGGVSDSFKVVNFYNPCKMLKTEIFDEIMEKVEGPVVWVGDFNAHNPLWGSEGRDRNGAIVEEFLDKYDLVVLNDGGVTRQDIVKNKVSCLDLTIATPSLARSAKWEVWTGINLGSDHFVVMCEFRHEVRKEHTIGIQRYNFLQARWSDFRDRVFNSLSSVDSSGSVEKWNLSLISVIQKAASECIPVKGGREGRKNVPWWTQECGVAVRNRNRAYKILEKCPTIDNVYEYKRLRAVARRVIKNAKKESWRRYCSSIKPDTPVGQLWSAVHRMSGVYRQNGIPVLIRDGVEAISNVEKANLLVESFQKIHSSQSLGEEQCTKRKEMFESNQWKLERSDVNDDPVNLFFTIRELKSAILAGANTSPGKDMISYIMLKQLDDVALDEVLALINSIWEEGLLPKQWKHAVVIPILKAGKNGSDPCSYRPISLTSVLCKIMERMVTERLVYFLESNGIFSNDQNGFRHGRSTMESVLMLDHDIKKALGNKESVVGVFLDVEKAYDSLWKDGLLIKMNDVGIKGRMFNWIKDFLRERVIQVRIGGVFSKSVSIENGTPQGSVISPVLFNLMINDVFKEIGGGFGLSLFADDGAIWKRGRNIGFAMKQVQKALNKVEDWGNTWGFTFSATKTKSVMFGFKRKLPNFELRLYGEPIERVKVFRFLGVWFDEHMKWTVHVSKIVEKCEKIMNVMRSMTGCEWGADRGSMLMIYRATIRAAIDYGCLAYGSACKTVLTKLNVVQAKALRICSGALRSSPIPALQVENVEMPLALRRVKLGLQYRAKLRGSGPKYPARCLLELDNGGSKYRVFVADLGERESQVVECGEVETAEHAGLLEVHPWLVPEPDVKLDFLLIERNKLKGAVEEYLNQLRDYKLIIYTDGSKDPRNGVAGFGIYIEKLGVSCGVRVSDNTSVFTTEMIAILSALKWVAEYKPSAVMVCSDSAAALEAIKRGRSKARQDVVNDILMSLYYVNNFCDVSFCWVPGHAGIDGNERADSLAKESLGGEVGMRVPLGRVELRMLITNAVNKDWQLEWEKEERGRHLFSVQSKVNSPCMCFTTLSRREAIVLCRLRIGHCGLNKTLHILGKHENGLCRCGEVETVKHVLLECVLYEGERRLLVSRVLSLSRVFSFETMLRHGDGHELIVKAVLQFLLRAGVFKRV